MALPAEASKRAATEAKEETKKEAQDAKDAKHKMPAREPIRMRRAKAWNVEVENAYRRGGSVRDFLDGVFAATAWEAGCWLFRSCRWRGGCQPRRSRARVVDAARRSDRSHARRAQVSVRRLALRRGVRPGRIWG